MNTLEPNCASYSPPKLSLIDKVLNDCWVQCEQQNCLKWRRISKRESMALDQHTPWYCHLNSDPNFASCDIAEEDYEWEKRVAKRCQLKYVTSPFLPGSLVYAKMPGYCKWPGVLSADIGGDSVITDIDGEPIYYHVEFFGEKHTHSWTRACNVELFTPLVEDETTREPTIKQHCTRRKGKRTKRFSMTVSQVNGCRRYRGNTVDHAKREAIDWSKLSPEQRLEKIHFKLAEKALDDQGAFTTDATAKISQSKSTGERKRKKNLPHLQHKPDDMQPLKTGKTTKASKCPINVGCLGKLQPFKNGSENRNVGSPSWLRGKHDLDERLQQSASLLELTKEEKYSLDLQRHLENRQCFSGDLELFAKRNNFPRPRMPVWQGVTIHPYDLFLEVYDMGGYEKVCEKRKWTTIFREFTGHYAGGNGGTVARKYYRRTLLPYEAYICGKDIDGLARESRDSQLTSSAASPDNRQRGGFNNSAGSESPQGGKRSLSENSSDISQLFHAMEHLQNECKELADQPDAIPYKQTYCHDDIRPYSPLIELSEDVILPISSPDKQRAITGGFPLPDDTSDNDNQIVPKRLSAEGDGDDSEGGSEVKVLHEMQALQHELALMEGTDEDSKRLISF